MQYSVPQFVDIEDKVIGPLTIKQFLWFLGGAGILLVVWITLPTFLAIIITIPVGGLTAALAFYKVNGMTFNIYMINLFSFAVKPKSRVWKRSVALDMKIIPDISKKKKPKLAKITVSDVNLPELVTILDNELNPQARSKPVTNPIEPLPVQTPMPQMPVAFSLNNDMYQQQPDNFAQQYMPSSPEAPMAPAQSPLTPTEVPAQNVPLVRRPTPIVSPIKSIKPFRK